MGEEDENEWGGVDCSSDEAEQEEEPVNSVTYDGNSSESINPLPSCGSVACPPNFISIFQLASIPQ